MRMLIEADQLRPRFMGKTLTVNHEGNQLKGTLTNLRVDAHPWEVKTVLDIITGYEQAIEATLSGSLTIRLHATDKITVEDA